MLKNMNSTPSTNTNFHQTFNPKKNKGDRRKRPGVNVATHEEIFVDVKSKSRNGIEYSHTKKVIRPLHPLFFR
jgi:hypothetical protein